LPIPFVAMVSASAKKMAEVSLSLDNRQAFIRLWPSSLQQSSGVRAVSVPHASCVQSTAPMPGKEGKQRQVVEVACGARERAEQTLHPMSASPFVSLSVPHGLTCPPGLSLSRFNHVMKPIPLLSHLCA